MSLHKSLVSAICKVLRPVHPNQRGSTQSELQILRCFSPFFIQRPLRVVYQFSHVISWATESEILTYFLPFLYCPSMTVYTYFPTSSSGYLPYVIYFRTSRLGCFLFRGAIWYCWYVHQYHGLFSSLYWTPYPPQLRCCCSSKCIG